MQQDPFHRARAMFAAIYALAQSGASLANAALQVGPYVSRGKGRGKVGAKMHCVRADQRAAEKARNRKKHRAACR